MSGRKLPLWKVVVFSLLPAVFLLVVIEGVARIVWAGLEANAMTTDPNKVINYSRVFDPVVGYRLKPDFHLSEGPFTTSIGRFELSFPMHIYHNSRGFMQREEVSDIKKEGSKRIITIGESTTQGHHVDENYPSILRNLLRDDGLHPGGVEVINAGVPGWVSDQWMLLSETELAALRPDVVIFYAGWNDFQSYNPHLPPPVKSHFDAAYSYLPGPVHWLKSVTLLGAVIGKLERRARAESEFSLDSNNLMELEGRLWQLQKELKRGQDKLQKLESASEKDLEKIERRKERIKGVEVKIQEVEAKIAVLKSDPGIEQKWEKERVRATYKFFLQNLDRSVAAFKKQNEDVRIVISTLVGRWPYESESYFREGNNSVWWMKTGLDDSKTAHAYLERFNDLIREYAKEKGWVLIDSDKSFENVRREEIQWDFAHFTDVGYRMLGETIYRGLMDQHVLD